MALSSSNKEDPEAILQEILNNIDPSSSDDLEKSHILEGETVALTETDVTDTVPNGEVWVEEIDIDTKKFTSLSVCQMMDTILEIKSSLYQIFDEEQANFYSEMLNEIDTLYASKKMFKQETLRDFLKPKPPFRMDQLNLYPIVKLQKLDSKLVMKRKSESKISSSPSKRVKMSPSSTTTTTSNGYIIPPLNKRELKKHLRLLKIFEEEDDDCLYFKDKLRSGRLKNDNITADPSPQISDTDNNSSNMSDFRRSILHCLWPQDSPPPFNGAEMGPYGCRRTRSSFSIYSLDKFKEDQDDIRKSHEGLKLEFHNEELEDPTDQVTYPDLKPSSTEPGSQPIDDKRLNKLRWSRQMSNGAANHLLRCIHESYYSTKGDEGENGEKKAKKVISEKTTNLMLREEFKKQHRLMRIFQEDEDDESLLLPQPSKNKAAAANKQQQHTEEVLKNPKVLALISRMQEASWNDRIVSEYPNHFKVGMLTRVLLILRHPRNMETFIHRGGLNVVSEWLELLPNGRLPHLAVREMMLRLLHVCPQDMDKIRESKVAWKMEMLLHHPAEHRLHKRWILRLLDQWAPPSPTLPPVAAAPIETSTSKGCHGRKAQRRDGSHNPPDPPIPPQKRGRRPRNPKQHPRETFAAQASQENHARCPGS